MALEKAVSKPAFNIDMPNARIEAKMESIVGNLLGDFKSLVWRGFIPYDYQDVKFIYKDWLQEDAPIIPVHMRAGRSEKPPAMEKWEEEITKILLPIFEYLNTRQKEYDAKNK